MMIRLQAETVDGAKVMEAAAMVRIEVYDPDTDEVVNIAWISPGVNGGINVHTE